MWSSSCSLYVICFVLLFFFVGGGLGVVFLRGGGGVGGWRRMGRFRTSSSAGLVLAALRCRRCFPAASSPPGAGACVFVCPCVSVSVRVRVPAQPARPVPPVPAAPSARRPGTRHPPRSGALPGPPPGHSPAPPGDTARPPPGTQPGPRHPQGVGRAALGTAHTAYERGRAGGALSIIPDVSWDKAGSEGTGDFPEKLGCPPWDTCLPQPRWAWPWSRVGSGDSQTKLPGTQERLQHVAIRGCKCSGLEIILVQGVTSHPSFILSFFSFHSRVTPWTSAWCHRGKQVWREPKCRRGYSCAGVCAGSDLRGICRMWVIQRRIRKDLFPFRETFE